MSSVTTVQMMLISISTVVIMPSFCLDNGLALTPPMGWSSWNAFHRNFNESTFMQTADVMAKNGMLDAGYEYINVDGGWWGGSDTGTITRNCLHLMIKCQKWSWLASSITLAECIIDSLPVPSEPTLTLTLTPKKKFRRNATGFIDWNHEKYPNGLPNTIKYIKSKGFKYGHYTDAGTSACNGDKPMSQG